MGWRFGQGTEFQPLKDEGKPVGRTFRNAPRLHSWKKTKEEVAQRLPLGGVALGWRRKGRVSRRTRTGQSCGSWSTSSSVSKFMSLLATTIALPREHSVESPGGFVKTRITGAHPQGFGFRVSQGRSENLYFWFLTRSQVLLTLWAWGSYFDHRCSQSQFQQEFVFLQLKTP